MTSKLKAAAEAILSGNRFSIDGLYPNEVEVYSKLKTAVDTLGSEICLEAYNNPGYAKTVYDMFGKFSEEDVIRLKSADSIEQRVIKLNKKIRNSRALPFIKKIYTLMTGRFIDFLAAKCSKNTVISDVGRIISETDDRNFVKKATHDLCCFLDWLDFDINSFESSLLSQIDEVLECKNERLGEVLSLRAEGKTLEEIGNNFGVTRERIRQIEVKGIRLIWQVLNKQKYDMFLLAYALLNGKRIIRSDDLNKITDKRLSGILWNCIIPENEKIKRIFNYILVCFPACDGETYSKTKRSRV